MSEPHSTAAAAVPLITLCVAMLGPNFGPYAVITMGAIGGSFWALANSPTATRIASVLLMVRCLMTALVLTAFIAGIIGPWFGVEVTEMYVVVAFVIAALGDKWLDILDTIKTKLQSLITNGGTKS